MGIPATLIRISTGEVLNRGDLPTSDPTQPIPGLDPDLEWLIDYEPFAPPLYDGRVFSLQTTLDATAIPHPDYPIYNQYKITYATIRRPVDDTKAEIVNKERDELGKHVDYMDKLAILGMAIIFRELGGLQLTPLEQAVRTRIINSGVSIYKNYLRRKQLEDEAEQLQDLDIDAGWEPVVPNDPV